MRSLTAALQNKLVVRLLMFASTIWSLMKPDPHRGFARNMAAFVSLGPVLAIVGIVLGVIIAVLVIAALAPNFFNATGDITDAFTNSGLSGTAGVIAGIVAILIPLALLFALTTLVLKVVR